MTPAFLAQGAAAAVLAALPGARVVGGAVRDHLAGRPIHDVDVAVPLPPAEAARLLRAAGLKVFETGLKHGTVTAVLNGEPVEVTSLRRDVATDGRHAEVAWTEDWAEDAARRDFTINAMSMEADGTLHDFFEGAADLAAGRVRFVGVATERLAEDYLRALRFFRFWARYGRGEPDAAAMDAIRDAVPGLARLSVERVWMELKRLLEAPDPTDALAWMERCGVLGAILHGETGGAADPSAIGILNALPAPQNLLLRFAALIRHMHPLDVRAGPGGVAFSFSHEELSVLVQLLSPFHFKRLEHRPYLDMLITPDDGGDALAAKCFREQRLKLSQDSEHVVWLRTFLMQAFWQQPEPERSWPPDAWDDLRRRLVSTPVPTFPLQGRDVIAMGVAPGWEVGRLLNDTTDWWLGQGARPDRTACLDRLRVLVTAWQAS